MLDTVIMEIKGRRFTVLDYSKFGTTKVEFQNAKGFRKYHNNPTEEDRKAEIYKPRLTLMKRGLEYILKVEFSVPKIIFGENVNELEEKDFENVVSTLKQKLDEMGIFTTENFIKEASISSFHPSKNILLTGGYISSFAISELSKVKLNGKFDFTETKFRNDGRAIQYYSKNHSLVFYDKKHDLKLPKSRAIDKDQTSKQLNLFNEIREAKKNIEILRMETRLSKKRKMNEILEKLGYPANPLFQDIFKEKICQKILKYYWETMITDQNLFLFDITNSPLRILQRTIKNNRKTKAKQIIYLTGLEILCKDRGIRELRKNIGLISKPKTWHNISKDIAKINGYSETLKPHGFIRDIESQLDEFKPFRLST